MKYKQGKFTPQNPDKWINPDNIIFRSGLELKFFYKCDNNHNILSIGSEEIIVPYVSKYDGKVHRYYPDLYLKVKNKHGEIKKFLVEIKPFIFCKKPQLPKSGRKTRSYLENVKNYIVNQSKWAAATEFAEKHRMKFIIITEKDL